MNKKTEVVELYIGAKVIDENGLKGQITDYLDVANMFYVSYEAVNEQRVSQDRWVSAEKLRPDVLVMSKNEYQEYLNRNAERLHTDANYSLHDYNRDAESVQVLGFELDKFNLTENDCEIVNQMFESDSIDRLGNVCLYGHLLYNELVNAIADTLECTLVCDNGHNGFYKHDEKRCVLEFCEGDITLVLCETDKAYQEELDGFCEFYELEREAEERKGGLDGLITSAAEAAFKSEGKVHKDIDALEL